MNAQIKSSAQIQSSFEPETEENIAGHDFSIWNLKFFNKSWNIQLQLQDESFSCQSVFFFFFKLFYQQPTSFLASNFN